MTVAHLPEVLVNSQERLPSTAPDWVHVVSLTTTSNISLRSLTCCSMGSVDILVGTRTVSQVEMIKVMLHILIVLFPFIREPHLQKEGYCVLRGQVGRRYYHRSLCWMCEYFSTYR